jgi:protein required for attachment to host cells
MRIPTGAIVLVTDGSRMLLLRNNGDDAFPELTVIEHRAIKNPSSHEQMSDAPGRSFSSMGPGRSAYQQADPHQQNEDRFAIEAASALTNLLEKNDGSVMVIAPPDTLGVLRRHYGRAIKDKLVLEIHKDLTKHPVAEITRHIQDYRTHS